MPKLIPRAPGWRPGPRPPAPRPNDGLRQGAAWAAAAVVYGAAQGLSAWAAARPARGHATRPAYEQFERPAFAPPGAVFPVVWSALNLTTATSAWLVWRAGAAGPGEPERRRAALRWWALAVVVRSGYVPLAFGQRRLWAATADSALLGAVMARYAALARRVDPGAAALAVPELAWTAFATGLSAAVARKNDLPAVGRAAPGPGVPGQLDGGPGRFPPGAPGRLTAPGRCRAGPDGRAGWRPARNLEGMTIATTLFRFEDSYAREVPGLSVPWTAAPAPAPELLMLNEELAAELGVDPADLRAPAGVALLAGQAPAGVTTVAQAYAGHQFGAYAPRLGDGRALLLGEVIDTRGRRRDLHLKGAGRTPFSRGGDGKAAVGPMLREYLIGEAMHGLGIPTTRALAVVATGEQVRRERTLPGAVLSRVAASHLRVGTFQYAAASGDRELLRALADYAIARHYPQADGAPHRYLDLYRRVVQAQASLVARWMLTGFVHGVMNTDNTTISGETIDYGPCAFMDAFDPATVFSSIDGGGRYAYGNQPGILQWNLARLAEALLPLIDASSEAAVDAATEVLTGFTDAYERHWADGMAAKLGLAAPDRDLAEDLLQLMRSQQVDFTQFFRALAAGTARTLFAEPEPFDAWAARRQARLAADPAAVAAAMDRVNPVYIPRNHRVEEALAAATDGELGPFRRLVDVVSRPFEERPGLAGYAGPAPAGPVPYVTYCGT